MAFSDSGVTGNRTEIDLLLSCSRMSMNAERAERVGTLLRNEIDWEYLLHTSISHGVVPLVYRSLTSTCPEAVPEGTMRELRDYFYANALRNLLFTRELLKILSYFNAHRVPAVPFKGPSLAESVYGDVSLRQFCDLDILVPRQHVVRAKEILISQGYVPEFPLTRTQEASYLESHYHYDLRHSDGRTLVELHWRIVPKYFSSRLDAERFWEYLEPISLGGKEVLAFSPEDLLLILCVHGSRERWARLEWICDVAELVGVHKRMNWQRVMDRARRLGSERMLFLGLFLASDLLGAVLPEKVLRTVQGDPAVKSLGRQVCERLFRGATAPSGHLEGLLFHLKLRDDAWELIYYCFRYACQVMTPTRLEWESLPLPDLFFPFYYVLRPVMLAGRYGIELWNRVL